MKIEGMKESSWKFISEDAGFEWKNPCNQNQLYFPVCNQAGMMSSITPRLNGDAKTSQDSFLFLPVSIEDLHNNRSARNFWIYSNKTGAYSLTGNSARQIARRFTPFGDAVTTIVGTFLAHTLIREDNEAGIRSEITIFCPAEDDAVEIMFVQVTNICDAPIAITPTTALPIYGRSADNLRDHRHATSLMHRIKLNEYGLSVKPVMHHDEKGHVPNNTLYFVLAVDGNGNKPVGQFPSVQEFIGDGGCFDWPEAVVKNIEPYSTSPNRRDGMEAVGAIRFSENLILPGQTVEYIVISGVTEDESSILPCIEKYGSAKKVRNALGKNHAFWVHCIEKITFHTSDEHFNLWMRWVALQPKLRTIYGCSFLPHHDYGRGGRGWRDLWQDYLAILLQNPEEVREVLISNFAGVRLDGSNATIILKGLGNFAADRNKISRVWMDHGVWPFYTVKLYIDQTGDVSILFEENTYWKDAKIRRAKAVDHRWLPADGNRHKTVTGSIYQGSLMEHMLIQHLTSFFNVGDHNNIKLEDADWNDQLDMAPDRGESVPFTAFYGWNLVSMSELLLQYKKLKGVNSISIFKELYCLLDIDEKPNYESPSTKRQRLDHYYDVLDQEISGEKVQISLEKLAEDLRQKGLWLIEHVRNQEWIKTVSGECFFNGYYNNDGERVDGDHEDTTRMNLTAQTFAIMSGAATNDQIAMAFLAASHILKDPNTGGFRLTTPLGPNSWNFGRGFALIYGEKENGGMFSHMAVMFMNALYSRGFVKEGYEVLKSIYTLCNKVEKAKMYPGIPEYINHEGQGMYHYLTGSASWLMLTMLTQIFGVRGEMGDLIIEPKLVREQFSNSGIAEVKFAFCGKKLTVLFYNPELLGYGDYHIQQVLMNGMQIHTKSDDGMIKLTRHVLSSVEDEYLALNILLSR
jgi:cellobiose phosphorylase